MFHKSENFHYIVWQIKRNSECNLFYKDEGFFLQLFNEILIN